MKRTKQPEKKNLHPRNQHRLGYDFDSLIEILPELKNFVGINEHQIQTLDFSNPEAVKALNKALLLAYYDIKFWEIPSTFLCPPIPGRVDYVHYLADLLAQSNNGVIPKGESVQGLDIGVGANCIYPILGNAAYGWSFVGTDIDEKAIQNCKKIIEKNPQLIDAISLQLQTEPRFIFKNIMESEDKFAFTICNPPFHNSKEEATKVALRKVNNLNNNKATSPVLNFGGQNAELWCPGGELGFITQMIYESAKYPMHCLWYTTLVSKQAHLNSLYKTLNKVNAANITTIDMAQGQKTSRILAWTFLTEKQQKEWKFE
ncbi:23S rRNA (adenine(1618)-N(6))-methyltransferase RlmF [Flavobacterium sp.]|jgi:23S rRNA (adenine1618-N6)-methyltransferase|uniref:23S rRNA (adenine(1618)-N(6))-methyltransferase RlmF n=1 Tax=Flavobacterium sp. TaxID=239 RepID=UPI0022BCE7E7|nr:23S rRNA (adenine(1618)-N(6))-methyltransferase RlmF [Flavobacterium sp.]MCZ8230173.1 23S rRNA (adenine(1618)-N(6))-methyltransferase RlmF [Flavobacterium sp.]